MNNISNAGARSLYTFNNPLTKDTAKQIKAVIEPMFNVMITPDDITNVYENIFSANSPLSKISQPISREQIYAAVLVFNLCNNHYISISPLTHNFSEFIEHIDFFYPDFTLLFNISGKRYIEYCFDEITSEEINSITKQNITYNLDDIRNICKNNTPESLYQGTVGQSPTIILEKERKTLENLIKRFNQIFSVKSKQPLSIARINNNNEKNNSIINDSKEDFSEIEYKIEYASDVEIKQENLNDNEYKDYHSIENEAKADNLTENACNDNDYVNDYIGNSSISSDESIDMEDGCNLITTQISHIILIILKMLPEYRISYNSHLNELKAVIQQIESTNGKNIIYNLPNYIYILLKILSEATHQPQHDQVLIIVRTMLKQFILQNIHKFEKSKDRSLMDIITKTLSFASKYLDKNTLRDIYITFTLTKLKLEIYEFTPLSSLKTQTKDIVQFLIIIESNIKKDKLDLYKTKSLIYYITKLIKADKIYLNSDDGMPPELLPHLYNIIQRITINYIKFISSGELDVIDNEESFDNLHHLLSLNITRPLILKGLLNSVARQLKQIFITSSTIEDMEKISKVPTKLLGFVLDRIHPTLFMRFIDNIYNLYTTNSQHIHKLTICTILVNFIKTTENILPIMTLEHIWEMIGFLYEYNPDTVLTYLLTQNNIKFMSTDTIITYYNELIETPQIHRNYGDIHIIKRESELRGFWLDIVFPPLKIGKIQYSNEIALYQVHNELNKLIAPLRSFIEAIMNYYKTEIIFDLTTKINPEQVVEIASQIDESFDYKDIYIYLNVEISRLFADDEENSISANAVLDYLYSYNDSSTTQFFADMRFIISFLYDDRPAWGGDFTSRDSRIKALIEGLIQSAKIYGTDERAIETRISCHRGCYERVMYALVKLTIPIEIFQNTYARCQVRDSLYYKIKKKLVYDEYGSNTTTVDQFVTHIANIAAQSATREITLEDIRDIIIAEEIKTHKQEVNTQLETYSNNHKVNDIPPELLTQHTNRLWNETVKPIFKEFLLETLDTIIELSDDPEEDPYNLIRIEKTAIEMQNKNN